jgi:hypothetical protein
VLRYPPGTLPHILTSKAAPPPRLRLPSGGKYVDSDNYLGRRIAAPEMLPHGELLPHLICSLTFCRGGGGHEAGEHGDAR